MGFLAREFGEIGVLFDVPFVCSRQLGALLGIVPRTSLADACRLLHLDPPHAHLAAQDTLAAGRLFGRFREELARRGLRDFRDVFALGCADCMGSWTKLPLAAAWIAQLPAGAALVTRSTDVVDRSRPEDYATAVLECISDLQITPDEIERLRRLREEQRLPLERVRAAHAAVFTWFLSTLAADSRVAEEERSRLETVTTCLRELGWAPGD